MDAETISVLYQQQAVWLNRAVAGKTVWKVEAGRSEGWLVFFFTDDTYLTLRIPQPKIYRSGHDWDAALHYTGRQYGEYFKAADFCEDVNDR